MPKVAKLLALLFAVVLIAAACGNDDDGGGGDATPTPTEEAPTPTPTEAAPTATPTPEAAAPVIDSFEIDSDVNCDPSSGEALAMASWATTNAESVDFSVDGEPVPADAGNPTSGNGNVPVPCDGNEHQVTLTASGAGGQTASQERNVTTNPSS